MIFRQLLAAAGIAYILGASGCATYSKSTNECRVNGNPAFCIDKYDGKESPRVYFNNLIKELSKNLSQEGLKTKSDTLLFYPIITTEIKDNSEFTLLVVVKPENKDNSSYIRSIPPKVHHSIIDIITKTCDSYASKSGKKGYVYQTELIVPKTDYSYVTNCFLQSSLDSRDLIPVFEVLSNNLMFSSNITNNAYTIPTYPFQSHKYLFKETNFYYKTNLDAHKKRLKDADDIQAKKFEALKAKQQLCRDKEAAILKKDEEWREAVKKAKTKVGIDTNCGRIVSTKDEILVVNFNSYSGKFLIQTTLDNLHMPGGVCTINTVNLSITHSSPLTEETSSHMCIKRSYY